MPPQTSSAKLLRHKVYTDVYAEFLRRQARARALLGLDMEALDSCGAGLGQSEQDVEDTRRAWERKAQEEELENLERTLRRQREGLDLLLGRGAALEGTTIEDCSDAERSRIVESGDPDPPTTKYLVYALRVD